MTIDKINLGKVFSKKDTEAKKMEKQIPTVEVKTEDGIVAKFRGATAAKLLAVMMGVASMGMGVTSCSESESIAISKDESTNKLLNELYKTLQETNQILYKLLAAQNENNADNKIMIGLLQQQVDQNTKIQSILADVRNDVKDITTAMYEIKALMVQANQNDEELQKKIDIIIAGQGSDSEKLQKLIDLNTEQNAWLVNIAGLIAELKGQGHDLGDMLEKFYNDYANNSAEFMQNDKDHTTLMKLMYQALLDGLSKDDTVIAKLDAIFNSQASDSEKLAQLIELVASIDNKMDILINKVSDLADNVAELKASYDANQDALLAELVKANGNLDKVIELQKENNKNTLKIAQGTDEIIAKLNFMGNKMLTIDELQDMLGPMFKEVVDKIPAQGITAAELSAILEAHKTDLTKTNSLIENLTAVVKNLNFGSGGISAEQWQAIADAIEAFRQQEATNDAAQMEAYQALMAQIAALKGGVDAMANAFGEAAENFNNFTNNVKLYGDEFKELLKQIRQGQDVSTATVEAYGQKVADAMVQAQQARNQQITLLQAILEKEVGSNGGGLTKEELQEVLAGLGLNPNDYTDLLQEISDKIGNVITSDDLQNFYLKTQPDLTKTNALIETLIDVLKNKNFSVTGDVNVNMLEVEQLLGRIFDVVSNGKAPSADQINQLLELVQQLVGSIGGGDQSTRAMHAPKNTYSAEDFMAALEAYNAQHGYETYNA